MQWGNVLGMAPFFRFLFRRDDSGNDGFGCDKRYDKERRIAENGKPEERLALAADIKTHPEILYYIAQNDPDSDVRQAVIANPSMPVQVSPVLALDRDIDVRLALAARLVSLLPGLSAEKHSQLYAYAVQSLGTLALDEVLKIRAALSSTLKDHAFAPPKVAGQLARDIERDVSEPILRYCAAVSDIDLLEILRSHPAGWVVEAIAGRECVSGAVSQAVIEENNITAGVVLLGNEGAEIGTSLLHRIVQKSREFKEWQMPVAGRISLPIEIARELADFVEASVRDVLLSRADFDPQTTEEISAIFRRRIDFMQNQKAAKSPLVQRIERMYVNGTLNDEAIADAMGVRDTGFVYAALAKLIGVEENVVQEIFDAGSPKPMISLCWSAGLSMRTALLLQKDLGRVPPKRLIYPKDGTDYPLTPEEIRWQLEFLDLPLAQRPSVH